MQTGRDTGDIDSRLAKALEGVDSGYAAGSTAARFLNLLFDTDALLQALEKDPGLATQTDENRFTLYHHAANLGRYLNKFATQKTLSILFKAPKCDLSLMDDEGRNPLHIAAYLASNEVTCQIFPDFVKQAANQDGFDFSALDANGRAVIHIAATTFARDSFTKERYSALSGLLKHAGKIDLNVLSASGGTAFFYAINRGLSDEANLLLDAGANPSISGSTEYDPLEQLKERIKNINEIIAAYEAYQNLTDQADQEPEAFIAPFKSYLSAIYEATHGHTTDDGEELMAFGAKFVEMNPHILKLAKEDSSKFEALKKRIITLKYSKGVESEDEFWSQEEKTDQRATEQEELHVKLQFGSTE